MVSFPIHMFELLQDGEIKFLPFYGISVVHNNIVHGIVSVYPFSILQQFTWMMLITWFMCSSQLGAF